MCVTERSRGEYEGLESTVPSSAISGGSVAAEWLYRTLWTCPICCSYFWARLALGPNTCSISFLSIIVPIPLVLMPFVSSQVPSFVPQEKKSARCCRFESLSDSGFIAQNLAFYRPQKAQTDISLVNKRITKSVILNTFAFINLLNHLNKESLVPPMCTHGGSSFPRIITLFIQSYRVFRSSFRILVPRSGSSFLVLDITIDLSQCTIKTEQTAGVLPLRYSPFRRVVKMSRAKGLDLFTRR